MQRPSGYRGWGLGSPAPGVAGLYQQKEGGSLRDESAWDMECLGGHGKDLGIVC